MTNTPKLGVVEHTVEKLDWGMNGNENIKNLRSKTKAIIDSKENIKLHAKSSVFHMIYI